jgi:small subunit ribosomal protein S21
LIRKIAKTLTKRLRSTEKFEKAKILLQLRDRQSYKKPSVRRRGEVLKAIYRQQIASGKLEP